MRVAQRVLVACMVCLPTIAFADTYPLNPPPDLFIDTISYTGLTLTGTVESITDYGNCAGIPCSVLGLTFSQIDNGTTDPFTISDGTNVWLAGNLITNAVGVGGEAGELFSITTDNSALWSGLEGQTASSFGSEVALDLHFFDAGDTSGSQPLAVADLAPTAATPEPASLTLLFSGLVAGLARKRIARKRNNQIPA